MDWLLMTIMVPLVLLFVLFGSQLCRGKWLFLVAGYNTLSQAERDKVNGPALGKLVGTILLSCAALMLLLTFFPTRALIVSSILIIFALIFGSLYYAKISPKFKK